MASLQAHIATWILKAYFKPRLRGARDMRTIRRLFTPLPYRVPSRVRILPAEAGGVPGEWVEGSDTRLTMLYLHGGGYFACSPKTHRPVTVAFARQGFRVFAPDYRLAPEHVFPAALDDACAAYRGLLTERPSPPDIVVAGDSAGGGLALALMIAMRDAGTALPAAAALFSPWTDLAATGESLVENDRRCAMFRGADIGTSARWYLGGADPRNPLASPLYADLSHLAPLLIHVGADEVLRDDSTRLADRARAVGVCVELKIWPVVPHAWQLAPILPEARQSIREAAAFLHSAAVAANAQHATARE